MVKLKGYPLLNNISLLYFVFILAIINIGGFIYINDNQSIFLFAAISIIVYFFNSNMIIVLLSTMIIVNTLIFLNKLNAKSEGYENEEEEEDDDDDTNIKEGLTIKETKNEETKNGLTKEEPKNELTKEEPKNELTKEDPKNEVDKLTDINDDTDTKSIKDKLKKIIPEFKENFDTISLDINNINKQINKLTSILE
jgi:hypothetical protein